MVVIAADKEDPRLLSLEESGQVYTCVVSQAADAAMAGVVATNCLTRGGVVLIQAMCGPVRAEQVVDYILLGELSREVDKNIMILTSPNGQPTRLEEDYAHMDYEQFIDRFLEEKAKSSNTRP